MADFDADLGGADSDWEIEIDVKAIATALLADQAFINAVAQAVRIAQTRQARTVGNLYGHTAQRTPPRPTTRTRLQ